MRRVGYHARVADPEVPMAGRAPTRRVAPRRAAAWLFALSACLTAGAAGAAPRDERAPAVGPDPSGATAAGEDLDALLDHLGKRARAYAAVALRFVCIESARFSDDPGTVRRYDYMYVEAEAQRYRPYRQKHTGRPGRGVAEAALELGFPDSYSWTLMFSPERRHLLRFSYEGKEWFSLRLSHILGFRASLPFVDGKTIYQWSGRVWVDAENYNLLKVEAEPGNQADRLQQELRGYRQAPRFLIFPMARRPEGSRYVITFLNEYRALSLPDQAEHREFALTLEGQEELERVRTLRYTGYQFFDVDVIDRFLR